jgi:NTE family protein
MRPIWVLILLISACSYPTRNKQATVIDVQTGYNWQNQQSSGMKNNMLFVVTASGGGTRATALTLSVLRALDKIKLASGTTLAEEVDIISSVSGGSVAAAYFALKGTKGFNSLEDNFIRKDGMSTLLFNALNPIGLLSLAAPSVERIDFLIDYLDDKLFHKATYQTLINNKIRRPLLILNATDMVEGLPFSFTQRKFDLLCSDLSKLPLATAVAASAAVPMILSPITLTNYSPCPIKQENNAPNTNWYDDPYRLRLDRVNEAYAKGKPNKDFIHLVDGGISDNLGLYEPLQIISKNRFISNVQQKKITKLIFITINARSFAPSQLDQQQATPGLIDMFKASIDSPIDNASALITVYLKSLLSDQTDNSGPKKINKIFQELVDNTVQISINFDAIDDPDCRRKFQSIPTSWSLDKKQIDALLMIGGELLQNNKDEFNKMLSLFGIPANSQLQPEEKACMMI